MLKIVCKQRTHGAGMNTCSDITQSLPLTDMACGKGSAAATVTTVAVMLLNWNDLIQITALSVHPIT